MVGRPFRVPVLAGDDLAAARTDRTIQPGRLHPARIVNKAHARIPLRDRTNDVPGAICRASVGDDHLVSIRRVVLREDGVEAGLDVTLLIEDRQDDTHEGGVNGDLCAP